MRKGHRIWGGDESDTVGTSNAWVEMEAVGRERASKRKATILDSGAPQRSGESENMVRAEDRQQEGDGQETGQQGVWYTTGKERQSFFVRLGGSEHNKKAYTQGKRRVTRR